MCAFDLGDLIKDKYSQAESWLYLSLMIVVGKIASIRLAFCSIDLLL